MTTHHVLISSASMPAGCRGRYVRIGVLAVAEGVPVPSMIRSRPGVEVVHTWERLHAGAGFPGGSCAASRALREARSLKAELDEIEADALDAAQAARGLL